MPDDLVRLRSVPSTFEGEIIRSRLESEGIPVLLKGGSSTDPYPAGPVHVFVPAEFEVQARLALADVPGEDGPGPEDEADPT